MSCRLSTLLHILCVALFLSTAAVAPRVAWASAGGGEKKAETPTAGDEEEEGGGESKDSKDKKDKKKKGPQTITGGAFDGDPVYVHLKPVIFPIISDEGAQQIVVILADLQIKDMETATKMSQSMPRLRDSIFRGLYGGLSDGNMRNANALNIEKIKDNIVAACNKVYGEGTVTDALIQAVSQRKL